MFNRPAQPRLLWGLAILLYGVGDTVTTLLGLTAPGVAEGSPVVGYLLTEGGVLTFLTVKTGFFTGAYLLWRVLNTPGRRGIPVAIVVVGAVVTGWNTVVLTQTLLLG